MQFQAPSKRSPAIEMEVRVVNDSYLGLDWTKLIKFEVLDKKIMKAVDDKYYADSEEEEEEESDEEEEDLLEDLGDEE